MISQEYEIRSSLRRFLSKIGVKSAKGNTLMDVILEMQKALSVEFGSPDKMYMSSTLYKDLQKAFLETEDDPFEGDKE